MSSIIDAICSLVLVIFILGASATLSLSLKEILIQALQGVSPKMSEYTERMSGESLDLSYARVYK
ncbi:MAG: hypothetical protein N4A33_08355 [Bacteriovoracaceae bacterium]|jgi:hypothetical protein|nr:hypothetical protein [Bacteriovoracaceae bacterium]